MAGGKLRFTKSPPGLLCSQRATFSDSERISCPPPKPVATALAEISLRIGGGAFMSTLVGSEAGNASD